MHDARAIEDHFCAEVLTAGQLGLEYARGRRVTVGPRASRSRRQKDEGFHGTQKALARNSEGQGQFLNLPLVHDRADFGTLRLQRRGIGNYRQCFFHIARLQGEIERRCRVDLYHDAGFLYRLETGRRDGHLVHSNSQVEEPVAARWARGRRICGSCFSVLGSEFGVGNGAAGTVHDGARDSAAVGLTSNRHSGKCKEKTERKKPQQGLIEVHIPLNFKHPSAEHPAAPDSRYSNHGSVLSRTGGSPATHYIAGRVTYAFAWFRFSRETQKT